MEMIKKQVKSYILLSILLYISFLLFYPFLKEFYAGWTDPEASSALMIPVFSAYMLWIKRAKLENLHSEEYDIYFSKPGFYGLIAGLILYIAGSFTYVLLIKAVAFIVILLAAILFVLGKDIFKVTLGPVFFLLFLVPIPVQVYYAVAEPLKYFIADSSAAILSLLNIPLLMDRNTIHLPSISLLVHESCSGIHTVISIVAISSAFSYMFLKSYLSRITFIMIAVPIGILTNILRVVMIGILAYLYDGDVAMKFHEHAWVVVTPVGIFTVFLIGNIFRCHERKDT